MPLTTLQKQWLKAISLDPRVKLFGAKFPDLDEIEPLFTPEDYYVYDKYSDGDDYENENTLWNTYNILQENLIKGGLEGWKAGRSSQKYERRKVTTRAITNIQQNIKFNSELWNMAENMYAIAA